MKVINNFLTEKDLNELQDKMTSHSFPWFYNPYVINSDLDNSSYFQFTHSFFNNHDYSKSNMCFLIDPILSIIRPLTLLRIKANLLTKTDDFIEHGFHTDYKPPDNRITTGIFYVNTNNGYTKFKNGQVHKSEENKFIEFNGTELHTGSTCTDKNIRIVINLNYIKTNDRSN